MNRGPRATHSGLPLLIKTVAAFFFPLFVFGGLAAGYYFYDTVRMYVSQVDLPDYHLIAPASAQQNTTQGVNAPPTLRAPNVSAGERINVLLMGIDRRPSETCPCRSDTMIIATFDPRTKTASMLSIPRDLYVPIPVRGEIKDRINTALLYGDLYNYPGGGPALAKRTIEYNLGIPIHYYAIIDFSGFRKIVDTLGGVDVDVAVPIHDAEYPTENFGVKTIDIPAGHIHMNGEVALEYARSRHTSNDFDRSRRQMQIIMAVREKALKLNVIPQLPTLVGQLKDAVQTDIKPEQVVTLAPQLLGIKSSDVKVRSIDSSMTIEIITSAGADVLWPERSKIAVIVRELFPELGAATSTDRIKEEAARVAVLNGTTKGNLGATAANFLRSQGINVVSVGNADRSDYAQSALVGYSDKPASLALLTKTFSVMPGNVRNVSDPKASIDFAIIVGADWTQPSQ